MASFNNCEPAFKPEDEIAFRLASNFNRWSTITKLKSVPREAYPLDSLMVSSPGANLLKIEDNENGHSLEMKTISQPLISDRSSIGLTTILLFWIVLFLAISCKEIMTFDVLPATPITNSFLLL